MSKAPTPEGPPHRRGGRLRKAPFDTAPELEAIASRLDGLPPEIHEKVLESLRRNTISKARVRVDRSL